MTRQICCVLFFFFFVASEGVLLAEGQVNVWYSGLLAVSDVFSASNHIFCPFDRLCKTLNTKLTICSASLLEDIKILPLSPNSLLLSDGRKQGTRRKQKFRIGLKAWTNRLMSLLVAAKMLWRGSKNCDCSACGVGVFSFSRPAAGRDCWLWKQRLRGQKEESLSCNNIHLSQAARLQDADHNPCSWMKGKQRWGMGNSHIFLERQAKLS